MDGSVSTLAPVFAAAFATHNSWDAFLVGIAASVGAGISMGFAEALSDDGSLTGAILGCVGSHRSDDLDRRRRSHVAIFDPQLWISHDFSGFGGGDRAFGHYLDSVIAIWTRQLFPLPCRWDWAGF